MIIGLLLEAFGPSLK